MRGAISEPGIEPFVLLYALAGTKRSTRSAAAVFSAAFRDDGFGKRSSMPQDDDGDCGTNGAVLRGGSRQGDLLQQGERESGEGGTETWRGTTTTTTTPVVLTAAA